MCRLLLLRVKDNTEVTRLRPLIRIDSPQPAAISPLHKNPAA